MNTPAGSYRAYMASLASGKVTFRSAISLEPTAWN